MKTKKVKPLRLGKKLRGVNDVSPSTSLPPLVEGQIRCFLRITVSKILWTILRPPATPLVRLRWWGETSNGTLFRPRDASQIEQKAVKTTARFAVRCGPKQFTSYLADMGMLVLEVMTKPDHLPVGRVQINGISHLSPTHSVNGFFTMISPTSEKLGELQVSLALEPLSDTYDSSSSLPTTDMSMDIAASTRGSSALNTSTSKTGSVENLAVPNASRKLSLTSASGKESVCSSMSNTPRGRDHLYFQENVKTTKDVYSETKQHLNAAQWPPAEIFVSDPEQDQLRSQVSISARLQSKPLIEKQPEAHILSAASEATNNVISVLLDKGSKLRDAMVVSAMKTNLDAVTGLADISYSAPLHNVDKPRSKRTQSPSGKLLHRLLESESTSLTKTNLLPSFVNPPEEFYHNTDATAIKLLLGSCNVLCTIDARSVDSIPFYHWDGTGSLPDSLSAGSDAFDESELNDPHYDQSLLENLFYKNPKYETSFSDCTSEEEGRNALEETPNTRSLNRAGSHKHNRHSYCAPGSANLKQQEAQKNDGSHPGQDVPLLDNQQAEIHAVDLTMDRLTLLGRIYLARVVIETLKLPSDSAQTTPKQKGEKGKPPRPVTARKCTYFVEYHFPVATSSKGGGVSVTTEITRVASSKIIRGVVKFQQRFVFPVSFGGSMIERWWNSNILFKIYSRKNTQKKPVLIGTTNLALRAVIQSNQLSLTSELPVEMVEDNDEKKIGPLKVSIELAADNKDFTNVHARAAASPTASYAVSSPGPMLMPVSSPGTMLMPVSSPGQKLTPVSSPRPKLPLEHGGVNQPIDVHSYSLKENHSKKQIPRTCITQSPQPSAVTAARSLIRQFNATVNEMEGLLLHVLLMVPDGKDFFTGVGSYQAQCNVYLKCKLFSTDEATQSPVSWSTSQPIFNFSLVAPVTLSSRLLEGMKNNMMVIEVWNKINNSGQEKLLGLVKLPLHQFYISFRDPKISHLLLQAQYPVVAVDSYMPLMDVFTGSQRGSLRVLLAMGEADQIITLQRLKNDEGTSVAGFQRLPHFLDQVSSVSSQLVRGEKATAMEHVFEVKVVKVKGLTPLQSTIWGEADCYVQYYFPAQDSEMDGIAEASLPECGMILKLCRTATTLCVPDPIFNDSQSHSLLVPPDIPVQRILLNICSKQDLVGGGGIQFEVWCRYYYPNVRDQLVAKAILPLSKLCAMVTMQYHKEVGIQTFSLPLIPRSDGVDGQHPHPVGLMDVSVKYSHALQKAKDAKEGVIASRSVTLLVQVHRASGLQAAARAVAERNECFQYQAEVGVNSFVTLHLSFLLEYEKRCTRTVARSFCPEFGHHTEFPCNLVIQRSSGESISLAELLQSSEAVFTIYHQRNTTAQSKRISAASSRDTVLGIIQIPLGDLLTKRTGISGWYGVSLPEDKASVQSGGVAHNTGGGGLDLSITFAHNSDRDRVIQAAAALDWRFGENGEEDEEDWQSTEGTVSLMVSMPRIWLPLHCLVLVGRTNLHKSTFCYLRYKLYDREAICTSLQQPVVTGDGTLATVTFDQAKSTCLKRSQSLDWYLTEEKLEVQVWVTHGKNNETQRPHDADRLIGAAYVNLLTLAKKSSRKLTVSGVYPLFKRGASDLSGAALRVYITLNPGRRPSSDEYSSLGLSLVEDDHECGAKEEAALTNGKEQEGLKILTCKEASSDSDPQPKKVADETSEVDFESTFSVSVVVERAMHLTLKGSPFAEQTEVKPSCFVSFATADCKVPVTTTLSEDTYSPIWDHQQLTRLSKDLLLDPQQTLVFKIWLKADIERIIGFASVDLSPLLSGFLSVCGWYNITDFSGQCQGQLKVAVTPLENIRHLRTKRWTQTQIQAAPTLDSVPYRISEAHHFFSSHISGHSEQFMAPSLNVDGFPATGRPANSDMQSLRHEEHMENVRRYHRSMQQVENSVHSSEHLDSLPQPSRSALFSSLRKNLRELDDIQKYFSQKLSPSPFAHIMNPAPIQRTNEDTMNHHHTSQESPVHEQNLLEKSNWLVSQIQNVISGQQERAKPAITLSLHSPQCSEENWERKGEVETERLHSESEDRRTSLQRSQSAEGENLKIYIPSEGNSEFRQAIPDICLDEENLDLQNERSIIGVENQVNVYGSDTCSEDGYEEFVIQPRTLNDVTVMTDRTSPWSSILSDLEEGHQPKSEVNMESQDSVGNGILPEEKQRIHASSHQEERLFDILHSRSSSLPSTADEPPLTEESSPVSEKEECDVLDQHFVAQNTRDSSIKLKQLQFPRNLGSDYSSPEEEEELQQEPRDLTEHELSSTQRDLPFVVGEEADPGAKGGDSHHGNREEHLNEKEMEAPREYNIENPITFADSVQHSLSDTENDNSEENELLVKLSDPIQVPNFFLTPRHLEASLKVLSIAPSFQAATADSSEMAGTSGPAGRRSNRPKPRLTSTELPRKETERIARIFAGHFTDKS
ncbi:C2 domain-containing protein 3 [Callorhinchus milii]|uniref:C2 domain-containing protein 3 n=1 Tax=Callorhinchus milii TaxID=7868 RepID=UPI001C3FCA69|nr:C2 domain-containing protein 3 [Callorhinchus milii]